MNARPGKLLVVDDDDAGRYVKAHLLRLHGFVVDEAANGQAALARCHEGSPDLVVLDTVLPDIDGTEVCRQVKASLPRVTILQTSAAVGNARYRVEALESGADAFLVEPIEPVELIATVNALLRMHRAEQDLRRLNEQLEDMVAERTRALGEANRRLAAESAERLKVEEVLWHAQKLEAVGQLTGGIAHDFNNLLAIIIGSIALLRAHVEGKRHYRRDKLLRLLSAVETAADRGSRTTKQMLVFARRSVLSTQVVILDEVLAAGEAFLRRALGETIVLELSPTHDAWPCRVDPAQFEAAILNLAVNARDAMPDGGSLKISTTNATIDEARAHEPDMPPAGTYIRVEVTDTGSGMDPETVRRAFEPFFTTKDVGKGTGLGLSQVHGFVTQSGGHISLQSEIDAGTTFLIHLPRTFQKPMAVLAEDETTDDVPTGGETILVVEDDRVVLELVTMTIGDLGYHVLSAANGPEALRILKDGAPIDLLFSDVVMSGGMNGFELVRLARAMRRGLKVLITSGYVSIAGDDEFPPAPILAKPYARGDLARRLRQVLDV